VRIEILLLELTIYKGERCHKRKGHSQTGGVRWRQFSQSTKQRLTIKRQTTITQYPASRTKNLSKTRRWISLPIMRILP